MVSLAYGIMAWGQLEGTKEWDVWDPIHVMPIDKQAGRGSAKANNSYHLRDLEHLRHQRLLLQPGDALFLPRGYIHQGKEDGGRFSAPWAAI